MTKQQQFIKEVLDITLKQNDLIRTINQRYKHVIEQLLKDHATLELEVRSLRDNVRKLKEIAEDVFENL